MKITISYKWLATDPHCSAWARIDGEYACAVGDTWQEARERLIKKLSEPEIPTPADEEVEVPIV